MFLLIRSWYECFVDFNNVLRHILQGNAGQKLEPSTIKGATLQNEFYNIVQVTACTAVRVLYALWFIHNEHHTNINFVAFNLLLLHVCRKIVHINNIRGYICIWVRWVILTIIFSRPNNFKVFNIGVDEGGGSRILAYVSHILVGCHTLPTHTAAIQRHVVSSQPFLPS